MWPVHILLFDTNISRPGILGKDKHPVRLLRKHPPCVILVLHEKPQGEIALS